MTETRSDLADGVAITIPAQARYLRLARMAAAALAGDLGFSLQEVEDVRVSVDEMCAAAVEHLGDPAATIVLGFSCEPGSLVATGRATLPDTAVPKEFQLHPVAREVLRIVATHFEIGASDGEIRFRVEKVGGPAAP